MRKPRHERVDLIATDINLNASHSGLDLLRAFKIENPDGHVLLISGFGTLETAIEAVRAGAFDYISKPFNIAEVKAMVTRALAHLGRPDAGTAPHHAIRPPGLVGRTSGMLAVYKQIAYAADSTAPVLIRGDSGTGKEGVPRDSWQRSTGVEAVRGRLLRRPGRDPARIGAVRSTGPSPAQTPKKGQVRKCRRRNHLSGRDRR